MIGLRELARLAETYADDLDRPVAPLRIGERVIDTDAEPILMGVVNLSRDSAYRESVAVDTTSALRMARVQTAQGATFIDVGAESSRPSASSVDDERQLRGLLPVVEPLVAEGITLSLESYSPTVVAAGLAAGVRVLNLTGSDQDDQMFALAAEHRATLILCHVLGAHARDLDGSEPEADPVPGMLDAFARRIDRARQAGVTDIAIDPGLGFGFRMDEPRARARYQMAGLLNTFRLRRLGLPICHALPHAFDIFGDQFRSAEGIFAVMAHLGGTGIYRTHEVPLVRSVLDSMVSLSTAD